MAKKEYKANPLDNLSQALADAGRVPVVNKAMVGYEPNDSILAPKPAEYLLMKLLGVDHDWVVLFDGVFSGQLHGHALVGVEDHPAVVLAQAMIVQRYGFIQHPHSAKPMPIHPVAKAKIDRFIKDGEKRL